MTGAGPSLPQGEVFDFDAADLRLVAGTHPYERHHAAAIDAGWALRSAGNPTLFDGRIVLFAGIGLHGRRLEATGYETRYATFMHWRAAPPDPAADHCFAHAVLAGADGALLAVRMGAHTANPGKVYFAAGSFEAEDVTPDGRVDAMANMRREVGEETGLELSQAVAEPGWHGWSHDRRTVLFKRFRFAETAEELARRVRAFVAAEVDPEIDGPVILRKASDLPAETVPHMPALVAWHFSRG